MDRTKATLTVLVLLALGLVLSSGGKGCTLPVIPTPGPKTVLVVHESSKDNPAIARLLTNLRDGPAAIALAEKGHKVQILDPDDKDANGQPVPVLEKFKPFTPPELLVLAGDKLVKRAPLPLNVGEVVEAVK